MGLAADAPLEDWRRMLRLADASGVTHVGLSDVQTRTFECYVQSALAVLETERVHVGPVVTNPVTRHPGVAASAAASLQSISTGRAFFGIGTGDSALRNLGL